MDREEAIALLVLVISILAAFAADPSHRVTTLPGQPQVRFGQYAGQVTVNHTAGKALFYWFYEADARNRSLQMPLAIWMSGGPGCSSVGYGALGELGPFRTNDAGTGLVRNAYAWNKVANLIFLEAPHGVGFSYSNATSDRKHYSDEIMASDVLLFILEWFKRFPEYSKNDFYLLGESYAGHYIPTLAAKIVGYNKKKAGQIINFKGFAIGNAWTDTYSDRKGAAEFLRSHSLISDEAFGDLVSNCDFVNDSNRKCDEAWRSVLHDTSNINRYNVYALACNKEDGNGTQTPRGRSLFQAEMLAAAAAAYDPCSDTVTPYLSSKDVRSALHVQFAPANWSGCADINYPGKEITKSVLPVYHSLLREGLKIWIYSGDIDSVVPTMGTKAWIKRLNLTVSRKWYPWKFQDQVGGWTENYVGLTFATVRGAGHLVPFDKPEQALLLFQHFIDGIPLPKYED